MRAIAACGRSAHVAATVSGPRGWRRHRREGGAEVQRCGKGAGVGPGLSPVRAGMQARSDLVGVEHPAQCGGARDIERQGAKRGRLRMRVGGVAAARPCHNE